MSIDDLVTVAAIGCLAVALYLEYVGVIL